MLVPPPGADASPPPAWREAWAWLLPALASAGAPVLDGRFAAPCAPACVPPRSGGDTAAVLRKLRAAAAAGLFDATRLEPEARRRLLEFLAASPPEGAVPEDGAFLKTLPIFSTIDGDLISLSPATADDDGGDGDVPPAVYLCPPGLLDAPRGLAAALPPALRARLLAPGGGRAAAGPHVDALLASPLLRVPRLTRPLLFGRQRSDRDCGLGPPAAPSDQRTAGEPAGATR